MTSQNIKLPDAVFWDWDGTLADSYGFLNDAHNHTLQFFGLKPFEEGEYRNYFGKPREILYPAIYKDNAEEAKEVFGKYVTENAHKVKVIEGAEDVLSHLKQMNVTMGIVSNKRADLIGEEIKHLGWQHFFKTLVGAGDAPEDKPSAEPLFLALKKADIDIESQEIWFVGDTENDLACASRAGCKSLFLKDSDEADTLISKYKPFFTFDNYAELKEFLVAIS